MQYEYALIKFKQEIIYYLLIKDSLPSQTGEQPLEILARYNRAGKSAILEWDNKLYFNQSNLLLAAFSVLKDKLPMQKYVWRSIAE